MSRTSLDVPSRVLTALIYGGANLGVYREHGEIAVETAIMANMLGLTSFRLRKALKYLEEQLLINHLTMSRGYAILRLRPFP
jgi:hypothetical protein